MSIIPKVKFHYSWIYDQHWQRSISEMFKEHQLNFLTQEQIEVYIKEIEPVWQNIDKQILAEISAVTGLPWTTEEVTCYMVARCHPISDPLTMHPLKDKNVFLRMFIHEMIHQNHIQGGGEGRWSKIWKSIMEKYPDENITTQIHIPVHATLKHILLKFYDQSWVDADIEYCKKDPYYSRAWEIVETEGYEKINKEFAESSK